MSLNLSNLKPAKGSAKKEKRIGRGGKRGSYSGRGMKGQRARSGGKGGLKAMGFRQTLQRIPKSRGFKSLSPKMSPVNLKDLESKFAEGEVVDVRKMVKIGLVEKSTSQVKILGTGKLVKKLTVVADAFSASAKKAIEAAGGKVEIKK